jgi:hypothetical protein
LNPSHKLALLLATLFLSTAALAANLTGVVTNRTTGKPSAGDTIAVINTAQGMDEIAHATTTSSGRFTVAVPDGGQILLHITHAGAEYFKSVPPGSASVDIDVYDSAAKISGIAGEALVLRAETDPTGHTLNVTENFFLQNASAPPRTQYGGNTFDFYLPKKRAIVESLANAPNGLPTNVKVVPVDDAAGHYAFTFPIRPGETRLQVAYSLPYSGSQPFCDQALRPHGRRRRHAAQDHAVPAHHPLPNHQPRPQLAGLRRPPAILRPARPVRPLRHRPAPTGNRTLRKVRASSPARNPPSTTQQSTSASDTRPGGGLGTPIDPEDANDPWSKYKWWILGLLGLALAAGAGVMLKAGQPAPRRDCSSADPTGSD